MILYTGSACDTLTIQTKILVSVVLLLLAVFILYYLCNKCKSTNQRKEYGFRVLLITRLPVQEDPFITSLNNIIQSGSARQVHIGDRFSSRDSYINSQTTRKERWWRPKTRYSVVDTTPFTLCFNNHIYKRIPFTKTSYHTITISVSCK